jgi:hypothetical protein
MPTIEARSQGHNQWYSLAPLSPARGRGQDEGATRPGSGKQPGTETEHAVAARAVDATPNRTGKGESKSVDTRARRVDTTVGDLDRQGLFGYKVRVLASLTAMESHAHH